MTNPEHNFQILGARISCLSMDRAVTQLVVTCELGVSAYICVADMNSVMHAHDEVKYASILRDAAYVLPDGAPVVLAGRALGSSTDRVTGPDFMAEVCSRPETAHLRHFFLGGKDTTLEQLVANLRKRNPGLIVSGSHSPPFRETTELEDSEVWSLINASGASVVWVGLGCPKQERLMARAYKELNSAVLVGVGAAFAFHAEEVRRAPIAFRSLGGEWLFRLLMEPRRLWRRYLVTGSRFVFLIALEIAKRTFQTGKSHPARW